jgi:outer membrane protein OmpA-like peptidoglycan-associated protein
MGLFFNYAANSLTYSKTLNSNYPSGQKRKDRVLGADVSLGIGLTDKWDVGFNIPFVLSQTVQDDYYVASYDKNGATEIKLNTKYHLLGDASGGVAAILSMNKNLIEDNPFAGRSPGLTWNYELAADTTLDKWAAGVNVGFRDRNPGEAYSNTPYVPLEDQYIYSVAGSYLISSIDTKIILELYGSRPTRGLTQDTERSLNSLEGLVGFKHDYSQNIAMHFGMTTQIDQSMGGADWRVYAGLNWAIGPVCKTEVAPEPVVVAPVAATATQPEEIQLTIQIGEVPFTIGSAEIPDELLQQLDGPFTEAISKPYKKILIGGHTDTLGPDAFNMDLSERRAAFVKKKLIEKHKIPADKIDALGFGPTTPIADNGNYQGRRKNRRVEVKIFR